MEGGVSPLPTEWSGRCREPRAAAPQKFACNVTRRPLTAPSPIPPTGPPSPRSRAQTSTSGPYRHHLGSEAHRSGDRTAGRTSAGGRAGGRATCCESVRASVCLPPRSAPSAATPGHASAGPSERLCLSRSARDRLARSRLSLSPGLLPAGPAGSAPRGQEQRGGAPGEPSEGRGEGVCGALKARTAHARGILKGVCACPWDPQGEVRACSWDSEGACACPRGSKGEACACPRDIDGEARACSWDPRGGVRAPAGF